MKKFFAAALFATTALTSAHAADLGRPVYKAPVVVEQYTTWNGFYIGGNAGYGWGRATAFDGGVNIGRVDVEGFTGGGQIGFNWHLAPNWVFGIEADVQGSNIGERETIAGLTARTDLDIWGTARGRLGYAAGPTLWYATGGFAWGRNTIGVDTPLLTLEQTKTHTGWTVGGGLEYAFAPNWSAKVEYLYVDLGRERYLETLIDGVSANLKFHTVRFGVNYRFGGAPIVASY
ncbi:hypothetical protein GJW-30_1_00089 [Variibacter gotjawalensis]|uniref:Outer membrane protein beta-barrel domain-containing protein n=1 Tax=Variibacter gotjawalensis TaxID=1333996 RepID=A0A0S3PNT6_9BRAD|nr:outer membrane protein [Variibacter gotjawalensis]NIK47872.1 outer membrane immunogenic protein [Variibacter gotjawalensis]RZS49754.1 outer membrane immunogenic protein [Variibacter gotjawalensis]BAT57583.1 hypothetical protein GJW-30_1_00089 [Variibacter gotjawalensis]